MDGQIDDGWGAMIPIKGREVDATILFSDIAGFSRRTLTLSPVETLIFANRFFTWGYEEALFQSNGIVDKYIGDEIMIVFSQEFGSEDPFEEAVRVARWMAERDLLNFQPHTGIASGRVIVGYVGSPRKYNCSVFGSPVTLAARCAGVKPETDFAFSSIVFPSVEWGDRDFSMVFPPRRCTKPDGSTDEQPHSGELLLARKVQMKNLPDTEVREIVRRSAYLSDPLNEIVKEDLKVLRESRRYWPEGMVEKIADK